MVRNHPPGESVTNPKAMGRDRRFVRPHGHGQPYPLLTADDPTACGYMRVEPLATAFTPTSGRPLTRRGSMADALQP
jgi:hypothetical protein